MNKDNIFELDFPEVEHVTLNENINTHKDLFVDFSEPITEATVMPFKLTGIPKIDAYNDALRFAKRDNKAYAYGYSDTTNNDKFKRTGRPVPFTDEEEFKKAFSDAGLVYVAYPDKHYVEKDMPGDTKLGELNEASTYGGTKAPAELIEAERPGVEKLIAELNEYVDTTYGTAWTCDMSKAFIKEGKLVVELEGKVTVELELDDYEGDAYDGFFMPEEKMYADAENESENAGYYPSQLDEELLVKVSDTEYKHEATGWVLDEELEFSEEKTPEVRRYKVYPATYWEPSEVDAEYDEEVDVKVFCTIRKEVPTDLHESTEENVTCS